MRSGFGVKSEVLQVCNSIKDIRFVIERDDYCDECSAFFRYVW